MIAYCESIVRDLDAVSFGGILIGGTKSGSVKNEMKSHEKEMMEKLAKSNRMEPTASASKDFFTRFKNMFE